VSLKSTCRSLGSRPIVTTVAIATLAVGLGVNTAIFSLTREVLLRPLPYKDADRLVRVSEVSHSLGIDSAGIAPVRYIDWRSAADRFEQTAIFRRVSFNISTRTDAEQVEGFLVDDGFFPMLGIEPALGRGFSAEDMRPGSDTSVLLTDGFWRRRFAADPAILGRAITVDGVPCTIVGVLPASFRIYRVLNHELDLFRPLVLDPTDRSQSLNVYAKLKPGVSIEAAQAQMATIYQSLPTTNGVWTATAELLSTSFANQSRSTLVALEWAVALVLLIACANIANLFLAASAGRRKELAVREALGATRWRIVGDLAGESLLVAAVGGVVAILFAMGLIKVLNAAVSFEDVNRLDDFHIDGWVLAFTLGLTAAVAIVFGLLPIRATVGADNLDALKDSAHGVTTGASNKRLRQLLVVVELALAIVLAALALSLTRSVLGLQELDRGIAADRVMTAKVSLNGPEYDDTERLIRTGSALVDRLAASPGVASAALVNYPPLAQIRVGVPLAIEGQPPQPGDQPAAARFWVITPDYFRTAGIRLMAGRDFTRGDDRMAPEVGIVSETFARQFWHTTDVVGRRLTPQFSDSRTFWIPRTRHEPVTVVGVAEDVREDPLEHADLPQLYLPYAQNPTVEVTLMARAPAGRSAESVVPAIRQAVQSVDPQLPVSEETTFDDIVREAFARPREMAWLLGIFAGLALFLAAIGVYGVIAHTTGARAREIGIRTALGASPRNIVSLVVGQAVPLTVAGVALRGVRPPLARQSVRGLLFGVGPFNPVTLAVVALCLGGVSIAAALVPAVRAARDASASLR
jgi:putative ABC transport system permease protein